MAGLPTTRKPNFHILTGDAVSVLKDLEPDSIDCVLTSPPYYALRDYHIDGQIGLEITLHHYLDHLMLVVSEVQRVLKPTGVFWLNLGDTYYNPTVTGKKPAGKNAKRADRYDEIGFHFPNVYAPVQRKSLMAIPWRAALSMLDRGWVLRNVVTWAKPNPMPHPVMDRLTASWEPVFMFTKSDRYFFDLDSIRVKSVSGVSTAAWNEIDSTTEFGTEEVGDTPASRTHALRKRKHVQGYTGNPLGKNPGDVWLISPDTNDNDNHFASFPELLVSRCLQAGCPANVCEVCGLPPIRTRAGWDWCKCNAGYKPGVVLDPFVGSGTTCAVAAKLGLDSIGIELNPEYAEAARRRVELAAVERLDLESTMHVQDKVQQLSILQALEQLGES